MKPKITKSTTLKIELAGQHHNFVLTKGFSSWGDGIEISTKDRRHYHEAIKIKSGEGDYEDWIDAFIAELQEFKSAIITSRTNS